MIVLDASALADWLLGTEGRGRAVGARIRAATSVHSVDLVYVEVVSVLRRKLARREMTTARADAALELLAQTRLRRHSTRPLLPRMWALRSALSAYDAAYVALAESLRVPLVTTDGRLARSSAHAATIDEARPL